MARWVSIFGVATAAAIMLLPRVGVAAEDNVRLPELLNLDGPRVDIFLLEQESVSGMGLAGGAPFAPTLEFGVILWDELKPVRPAMPAPHPTSVGQGHSNLNGTIR